MSVVVATVSNIIAAHKTLQTTAAEFGAPFPLTTSNLNKLSPTKLQHLRALDREANELSFRVLEAPVWNSRGYDKPLWVVMFHRRLVSVHTGELDAIENASRIANNPLRSISVFNISPEDGRIL